MGAMCRSVHHHVDFPARRCCAHPRLPLPSSEVDPVNQAQLVTLTGIDLPAWTQLLLLDGELAPKRLATFWHTLTPIRP